MTNMFGLVPFVSKKNLAKGNDGFHSLFDMFNEPFFNDFMAPSNWGSGSFKVDVKETDAAEKISAAQSIADACAEHIPHLLVNDEMEGFLKRIRNAPTVCFIDEQGRLVGQPVIGNEPELIRKEAHRLMETDSPQEQLSGKIQTSLFR